MAIADLDKDFRLEELVDQPRYYELSARETGSEILRTAIKLSVCKKFNKVAAISGLDVIACAIDQHCKMVVRLSYLASDEQHRGR